MLQRLIASSFTRKWFLLTVLLFISATLILARFKAQEERSEIQEQATTASSVQDPRKDQLEAELVTITPTGFEPAEVTRPQGRGDAAVEHLARLGDAVKALERPGRHVVAGRVVGGEGD